MRLLFVAAFVAACAEPSPPRTASSPPTSAAAAASSTTPPRPGAPELQAQARVPEPEEIFARVRADLVACYEHGKKAIPTMTSGKLTLHASVDRQGKTTCVVPSDDTGLTTEVEDCMRERLGREAYPASSSGWSTELPIVVREAALSLGTPSSAPVIETVESHGLSEDVYPVVEALLPDLKSCMQSIDKAAGLRVVHVGGRVGPAGKVECAVVSSTSPIPVEPRECMASIVSRARFAPPRRGYGLISIPLAVFGRK